ncbi:MAG: UbiA family prenyltransferase [Alphaproteobacteria bacterium]|nr:UbiA family prenyltransferase [Alphaproteobacteria bacterium]
MSGDGDVQAAVTMESATAAGTPLVVDMDGTLLRTDVLYEGMAAAFAKRPLAALAALPLLLRGRAPFKRRIAEIAPLDVTGLPARDDFVGWLQTEKARGREVHLVSAGEESVVQAVAARFGVFDTAQGSDGTRNLKGSRKAEELRRRFPGGYVYAGDSHADLAVWRTASAAVLTGASPAVAAQAARLTTIEKRFDNPPSGFRVWRKALRLQQWAKNLLLFAPLFLAGAFDDAHAILMAMIGFVLVGLTASGTYVLNDLADLQADRRHRTKRNRPFASGALGVEKGMIAAPVFILGGLAAAFALDVRFGAVLLIYLITTLSYSFRLKTVPFLDVSVLAGLYTLRLIMGAVLIGAPVSAWLLTFSAAFFLSLSLAKRHVEVAHATGSGKVMGRGYRVEDAPLTLAFGVASGLASIQILVTYLMEEAFPSGVYAVPAFLWAAPVLIALWVMRIWLLAHRGELDDDPVAFAVRDRISYALGAGLAVAFGMAVFA